MTAAAAPAAETVTPAPAEAIPEAADTGAGLYKGFDINKLLPDEPEGEAMGEEAPPAAAPEAVAPPPAAAAPPEPPKEEVPPAPMAKAFAELTKKEARTRAKEEELKKREADLAEKQAAIQNLIEDPLSHLEKLGITYEVLTEQLLNGKKPPADLKTRAEIQRLKEAVAAREKADKEREERAEADRKAAEEAKTLAEFKATLTTHITKAGEKFELINAFGEHDMVFDVIDAYAAKTGKILPTDEAAAQVEAHLEERELQRAQRALQSKKLSGKLQPVSPAPQRPSGGQSATQGQKPRTLTASNAVATSSVSHTPLTDEERFAKAQAILESGEP